MIRAARAISHVARSGKIHRNRLTIRLRTTCCAISSKFDFLLLGTQDVGGGSKTRREESRDEDRRSSDQRQSCAPVTLRHFKAYQANIMRGACRRGQQHCARRIDDSACLLRSCNSVTFRLLLLGSQIVDGANRGQGERFD